MLDGCINICLLFSLSSLAPVDIASAAATTPVHLSQGVSELFTTAFFFLLFMFLNVFLTLISTTYSRFPFSLNVMTNDLCLLRPAALYSCVVCKYIFYLFMIALSEDLDFFFSARYSASFCDLSSSISMTVPCRKFISFCLIPRHLLVKYFNSKFQNNSFHLTSKQKSRARKVYFLLLYTTKCLLNTVTDAFKMDYRRT